MTRRQGAVPDSGAHSQRHLQPMDPSTSIVGMILTRLRFLCFCLAMLVTLSAPSRAGGVTVFAAASTLTAMEEIAADFEARTGHRVTLSFAGTSALARQIQAGAPADVFLSASPDWMDVLATDDLIAPDTRRDLLTNRLVLIGHGQDVAALEISGDLDLAAMLGTGRLAMALVNAVPAGIYGKAALSHLGLWDAIAPRVAQTDNVRAALALVALGEAPLGIVYASDAVAEPRVTVLGTFPKASHPPIRYPVAAVAGRLTPEVEAFLAYLDHPDARAAFVRQGFGVQG